VGDRRARLRFRRRALGAVTIVPLAPEGSDATAGGFPAMTGAVPLVMKGVVLLAAPFYLLKRDAQRVVLPAAVHR
jgi:uncharacterized membrane protein YkgB